MTRFFAAALMLCLAVLPAKSGEHDQQIQGVIVSQLEALGADDLDGAFSHASPFIQSKFRNPEIFGQMVRQGYPVIWRPGRYRMEELLDTERGPVQRVWFEDAAGRQYEAFYEMVEIDGVWRINGVYLRELPGVGS